VRRPPAPGAIVAALALSVSVPFSLAACSSASKKPAATSSTGGPPAVANATDLKSAPVVSAGSGTPPSALVTRDLVVGTGPLATGTSAVNVQYVGANYADGKVFDSSWQRGQPTAFPLSQVVPGFAQGITGMHVGGRREIVIPPALGYGASGNGPVGPNETLVFVVDLVGLQ
jgi:peptidylprolyl isomerase